MRRKERKKRIRKRRNKEEVEENGRQTRLNVKIQGGSKIRYTGGNRTA